MSGSARQRRQRARRHRRRAPVRLGAVGLLRHVRRHEHAEPAEDRGYQSLRRERSAVARQARRGDPAGGRQRASWRRPTGPLRLPPPRQNAAGASPAASPATRRAIWLSAAAVKSAWSADAGTGSSFYGKLTASPIVYDDKVFTLDAAGKVSAFSISGGSAVWRASTTPPNEKDQEGFGGGLAADGGRIYAGHRLRLRGGARRQRPATSSGRRTSARRCAPRPRPLPSACSSSPRKGRSSASRARTARELWNFRGMPERASLLSNASPAVDGDIVVVPYPTGDLVALRVVRRPAGCGRSRWRARARARRWRP